jgi:hypothetical protein
VNEDFEEFGNPDLRHTIAQNVDFRYEYFPRSSEQFMVGLFYKHLKDPIEIGILREGQGVVYSPVNFGDAVNCGVEADVTKYFRSFGVRANYTFTQSQITTGKLFNYDNPDPTSTETILVRTEDQNRPLYGQAEHVANISLLYRNVENGWDAQLAFSYTGDRLYAVSLYKDNDIWQSGFFQFDASFEKRFASGVTVFAKATNLLNTSMTLYMKKYNPANEKGEKYETFRGGTMVRRDFYGQNLQIGLKYKF